MKHEEQSIQIALVQYIRTQYPKVLFSISPGGLIDNARKGSLAKKMGYTKGTPDIMIFKPKFESQHILYCGLMIELKTKTGHASKEQIEWIKELNNLEYFATTAFGFDDAKREIDNYLSGVNL